VLFRQVKGMKEGDVGVLRKIRAVKDVFVFNHDQPLSKVMKCE
jgi:hypothetical protein